MLALKQLVNFMSFVPPQVDSQPVDLDEQLAESSQHYSSYLPSWRRQKCSKTEDHRSV